AERVAQPLQRHHERPAPAAGAVPGARARRPFTTEPRRADSPTLHNRTPAGTWPAGLVLATRADTKRDAAKEHAKVTSAANSDNRGRNCLAGCHCEGISPHGNRRSPHAGLLAVPRQVANGLDQGAVASLQGAHAGLVFGFEQGFHFSEG